MTSSQSKYTGILIHVLIWAVVLVMPLFVTSPDRPLMSGMEYVRFLVVPISFMVIFYINYFLLIDRLLTRHRLAMFIVVNVLMVAVVMAAVHLLFRYVLPPDLHRPPKERPLMDTLMFFMRNALMYFLVIGASVAVRMTGGWYKAEAARKELEHRRSEAELQNLKSQINPHFLFNTLNNIYSLIQIDTTRAQTALHDLSHLLRYVLYGSNRQSVPLDDEVHFIREYIDLMRLRLPRHVNVNISLTGHSGTMIAPLLFIALVENAFKHGVSNDKPSHVNICITFEDGAVICETHNSYFPKSGDTDRSGSGIGISNLSRRLEMLYPGHYILEYGLSGDEYRTYMRIKL